MCFFINTVGYDTFVRNERLPAFAIAHRLSLSMNDSGRGILTMQTFTRKIHKQWLLETMFYGNTVDAL
jgi:hypothetical protein